MDFLKGIGDFFGGIGNLFANKSNNNPRPQAPQNTGGSSSFSRGGDSGSWGGGDSYAAQQAAEEADRREAEENRRRIEEEERRRQEEEARRREAERIKAEREAKLKTLADKHYQTIFEREKSKNSFIEKLFDNGSTSRRAKILAETKARDELINQGYDKDGNVKDANALKTLDEVSDIARQNVAKAHQEELAKTKSIGAHSGQEQDFLSKLNYAANATRNMNVGNVVLGVDDTQNFGLDDIGRFGTGILQGIPGSVITGTQDITSAIKGEGTDRQTGETRQLDGLERLGRGVSGVVDVGGSVIGGSGALTKAVGGKALTKLGSGKLASFLGKELFAKGGEELTEQGLKVIGKEILKGSAKEGIENGIQTGAQWFGDGGKINSLEDAQNFGMNTLTGAGMGVLSGGLLGGLGRAGDIKNAIDTNNARKFLNSGQMLNMRASDIVDNSQPVLKKLNTPQSPFDPNGDYWTGGSIRERNSTVNKLGDVHTDRFGNRFTESEVPVSELYRDPQFQPRITASGKGTSDSVFNNGFNEGMMDQPFLVRKTDDGKYQVLGGHSRTEGLERRAQAGLENPDVVPARVYEGIDDKTAMRISHGANQGGQYESIQDMAKSIADARQAGIEPSVQKQNLVKGFTYDDYEMLNRVLAGDNSIQNKVFHGAISQEDMLKIARTTRRLGFEPDNAQTLIRNMEANGKGFDRAQIEAQMKRLSTMKRNAENENLSMFDFDTEAKRISTEDILAADREIRAENTRNNALKKITKNFDKLSDEQRTELRKLLGPENQPEPAKMSVEKTEMPEMTKNPEISETLVETPKSRAEARPDQVMGKSGPIENLSIDKDGTIVMPDGMPAKPQFLDVLGVKHNDGKIIVEKPVENHIPDVGKKVENPNVKTVKMSDETGFMPDFDENFANNGSKTRPEPTVVEQPVKGKDAEISGGENVEPAKEPTLEDFSYKKGELSQFGKKSLKNLAKNDTTDGELSKYAFNKLKTKNAYKQNEAVKALDGWARNMSDDALIARGESYKIDSSVGDKTANKGFEINKMTMMLKNLEERKQAALTKGDTANGQKFDNAIVNLIVEIDNHSSDAGKALAAMKLNYENMSPSQKANAFSKKLGLSLEDVQARLGTVIQNEGNAYRKFVDTMERIEAIKADAIQNGTLGDLNVKELVAEQKKAAANYQHQVDLLGSEVNALRVERYKGTTNPILRASEGELTFARSRMLSDPTRRLNDVLQTLAVQGKTASSTGLEHLMNKGVNLFRKEGDKLEVGTTNKEKMESFRRALGDTKDLWEGKKVYDSGDNVLKHQRRQTSAFDEKTGGYVQSDKGLRNAFSRFSQKMTGTATALTRNSLYNDAKSMLRKDGMNKGLSGKALDNYVALSFEQALRDPKFMKQASERHNIINTMNDNIIADGASKLSQGASNVLRKIGANVDNAPGKFGLNAAANAMEKDTPFVRFPATKLYNTLTEHNPLYTGFQTVKSAVNKDVGGITKNLSKTLVNGGVYGAGLAISNAADELIEETDHTGKDYGNGYHLKIGDRKIATKDIPVFGEAIAFNKSLRDVLSGKKDFASGAARFAQSSGVSDVLKNAENTVKFYTDAGEAAKSAVNDGGRKFGGFLWNKTIGKIPGEMGLLRRLNTDLDAIRGEERAIDTKAKYMGPKGKERKDDAMTAVNETLSNLPFVRENMKRRDDLLQRGAGDSVLGTRKIPGAVVQKQEEKAAKESEQKANQDTRKSLERFFDRDKSGNLTKSPNKDRITVAEEEGAWEDLAKLKEFQRSEKEKSGKLTNRSKAKFDTEINRYKKAKELNISPEDFEDYKKTGVEDWRKLANPYHEDYDPERAATLKDIDEKFKSNGVSFHKTDPKKNKYSEKTSKSGSGRRSGGRRSGGGSGSNPEAIKLGKDWTPGADKSEGITLKKLSNKLPQIQAVQNYDNSRLRKVNVKRGIV